MIKTYGKIYTWCKIDFWRRWIEIKVRGWGVSAYEFEVISYFITMTFKWFNEL